MALLKVKNNNGEWVEIPAIQGKTAYQFAVEKGYAGTETQFSQEQAAVANNSSRLSKAETNIANLSNNLLQRVPDQDEAYKLLVSMGGNKAAWLDMESLLSYGIEWDTAVSTSKCTRIGNLDLHRQLPVQSLMRGCLLSDEGDVIEYLTPNNWSAHVLDGSNGQVMVEIPTHYRKFVTSGTKQQAWISLYPLSGYHEVSKCYMSAYEASFERSTGKLCSVVNTSTDYRGGINQADWDGTYRSVLGRPVVTKSRTAFRTAARLRKSGSCEWNSLDYNAYKAMFWLYYIEYADRNCQVAFNAQKDVNGFTQGGIGNGVTTLASAQWVEYNGEYPFVPCGHTNELGNASGEVAYAMPNSEGTTFATVYANRYRGIEIPFGHISKWSDGINIEVQSDAEGGASNVFVANNPVLYNDINYNGYTMRGLMSRPRGFIKEVSFGEFGDITASNVGGSGSTHWCDYYDVNIPSSGVLLRGMICGGKSNENVKTGLSAMSDYYLPSFAYRTIGSRLCFIPQK